MDKYTLFLMVFSVFVLPAKWTHAQNEAESGTQKKPDVLKIVVSSLEIDDKALNMVYEIRNNSEQDIWICDNVCVGNNFELFPDENGQTLILRKRLDVPSSKIWIAQPDGKYIRLRPCEKRVESLLLDVPVNCFYQYESRKGLQGIANATRLSIEIGYYVGDLPEMFLDMLREAEKTDVDKLLLLNIWFGGALGFNEKNEKLKQRDEEVFIPYNNQKFKGEQVLRTIIDDIKIPYKEPKEWTKPNPPDLNVCTRVEIQYYPSMLEFFFPYQSQQSLLSREEIAYLKSEKTIVIENTKDVNEFASEIKKTEQIQGAGIVSEKSKANVFYYRENSRITSFIVYDDISIETEQKQRIKYNRSLQSLNIFTPQIKPFELRMNCASNLKNLWHRLRLYDRAEKTRKAFRKRFKFNNQNEHNDPNKYNSSNKTEKKNKLNRLQSLEKKLLELLPVDIKLVYPMPTEWCDAMESAYSHPGVKSRWTALIMKSHICPSIGKGRSTYAMNPNCEPNSPPDMVLLFETKAGWNQHGGPELFTYDNHDPRGGCVLLNDGTVKFIRTEEEIHQLRWK